jgi:flagellar basal body rod protein FlgB
MKIERSKLSFPTAGATSVTITGYDFSGATAVDFGATAASSFTVNSATSITAVAPAASAGTVDITVTAPAGTSATSVSDEFTSISLTLTNPGTETNSEGNTVSLSLSASDSADHSLAYSAIGLPAGLAINPATGTIYGTITDGDSATSPYSVTVTVTDSVDSNVSASQTFAWNVNPTVTLANPGTETNSEGDTVSLALTATDSAGNALQYTATNLPQGISINYVTGVISGTIWNGASLSGPYSATVTATDSVNTSVSVSQTFTWNVNPVVTLANPGSTTSADGDTVYVPLSATDSAGNALTYSAVNLPPGLSVNELTGIISGTISAGADADSPYTVAVTATDSVNTEISATLYVERPSAGGAERPEFGNECRWRHGLSAARRHRFGRERPELVGHRTARGTEHQRDHGVRQRHHLRRG